MSPNELVGGIYSLCGIKCENELHIYSKSSVFVEFIWNDGSVIKGYITDLKADNNLNLTITCTPSSTCDLSEGVKVMAKYLNGEDIDEKWYFGTYVESHYVVIEGVHDVKKWANHIIPFSLFDPNDPDKYNKTENDYGTEGSSWEKHIGGIL